MTLNVKFWCKMYRFYGDKKIDWFYFSENNANTIIIWDLWRITIGIFWRITVLKAFETFEKQNNGLIYNKTINEKHIKNNKQRQLLHCKLL